MCKHILNAQVAIRAPCCRRFFDCPQCHAEQTGNEHKLARTTEMQFVCKQCKRAFRKDLTRLEEEDEYCPHCDNHFVIEAKTPALAPGMDEEEDGQQLEPDHDTQIVLDERLRYDPRRNWLAREMMGGEEGEQIDEGGLVGVLEQRQEAERQAMRAAKNLNTVLSAAREEQRGVGGSTFNDDDLDWT